MATKSNTKFTQNLEILSTACASLITSENEAATARKNLRAAMTSIFAGRHLAADKAIEFVATIKPLFQAIIDSLKDGEIVGDVPGWDALRNAITKNEGFSKLYSLGIKTTGGSLTLTLKKKVSTFSAKENTKSAKENTKSAKENTKSAKENTKSANDEKSEDEIVLPFDEALKVNFEAFMKSQIDLAESVYDMSADDAQQLAFDTISDSLLTFAVSD